MRQSRSKTSGQPAFHVTDSPVGIKAPATCSRRLRRTSPHVAGDKNDQHVSLAHSDALLQFEAIESWKREEKRQARMRQLERDCGWSRNSCAEAEVFGLPGFIADQQLQRVREPKYRRQQRTRLKLRLPSATIPTDPQTRTLHSFYSPQSTECGTLTSGEVPN
jgi:hypothetical protein